MLPQRVAGVTPGPSQIGGKISKRAEFRWKLAGQKRSKMVHSYATRVIVNIIVTVRPSRDHGVPPLRQQPLNKKRRVTINPASLYSHQRLRLRPGTFFNRRQKLLKRLDEFLDTVLFQLIGDCLQINVLLTQSLNMRLRLRHTLLQT